MKAPKPPKPRKGQPPLECVECDRAAPTLTTGREIYPHRPDLWDQSYWRCECGAYVGCHKGTDLAKGRTAKKETLAARGRAHAVFDPLWRAKSAMEGLALNHCRGLAYKWLADQMQMSRESCHIGWMTREQADRVVSIVAAARAAKRAEKAGEA